jgi:outer membrane protein assembly factor BamB
MGIDIKPQPGRATVVSATRQRRSLGGFALVAAALVAGPLAAQLPDQPGEWPAWRGPNRDGLSKESGLLTSWPEDGPKLLWKVEGLGDGFSTPSVANDRIFLMGAKGAGNAKGKGKDEYLVALKESDGSRLWEALVGKMTGGHPGPRSTPTVDGDRIYVMSSDGKLLCADVATGKPRWTKDLRAEFGGKPGGWAYTESPLIDGDLLICTPGGERATLAALDKHTGAIRWLGPVVALKAEKRPYHTAGYSSVVAANIHGMRQYVQFLSGGVVGLEAKSGKLLWHYDKPANTTANISTPLWQGNRVFAASGYGTGGGQVEIVRKDGEFEAVEKFFLKNMQNHHGGMILLGNHFYGTNGNALLCVDWLTGAIAWQNRSVGKGSVAYADGHLYVRSEKGPVALVEATPKAYREKGRFEQPDRSEKNAWAHPVVAGGRLYLRDWDILLAYDVKSK